MTEIEELIEEIGGLADEYRQKVAIGELRDIKLDDITIIVRPIR